ncbi:SusC/RagA family TonB-linked outer membrane protein [uncultured Dokdonia sp.]|uniref:SusC/RagA family TonB-linked outer membrane protein n=1 Tax=Dokdonia sp. R78006 TaxID=3093866 RepID=UPI0026306203|nr:SusC/RagA family TonB-linked outer membrane protein [uncultured Dokdonia sp.]
MKQKYPLLKMVYFLLFLIPCALMGQSVVTGVIKDAGNNPIPFVNVIEKGSSNGTTSDFDGNYSITLNGNSGTLEFSYLGYATQEKLISSSQTLNVTLEESSESLDEVVISGLASSVKRSNAANAVASVSAEQITGTTPPPTLDGALYGKFAGALVSQNSGAPGGGLSIKLRGATSIQGNTQPLYIVDGVYVDNSSISAGLNAVSAASAGGSASNQDNPTNRIADINPDDIENIEILKGASAAAIYGSRAAAGVVIITTKKGKAGETQFKFGQSFGWTQVTRLLGLRNYNEQRVEDSFGAEAVPLFIAARDEGRLVDYEEEIYGEKGLISKTNFSMSGGDVKTRFYAGVTHSNENGIVKNTGYEKTSLRLNLDHRATDFLKVSLNTNYINSKSDRGFFNNDNSGTTIGVTLTGTTPWLQLFPDENGVYPDNPSGASNPLQTRDRVTNEEIVDRFIIGASANLDIFKKEKSSLELILRGGLDTYGQKSRAIFPKDLQFQKPANGGQNGVAVQGDTQNRNYNLAAFLVHNYRTDNDLSFRTQAGVTREYFDRNTQLITASGLVASETNVDQAANTGTNQFRLLQEDAGFFVQEEINFQDKLIGAIGLRGDKSSNNGDANELNYYPKASLAANFNEFDFWKEDSFVDKFKLRVAYGEAGNFAPFGALFTSYTSFSTNDLLGISLVGVRGDGDLSPERQKELEFGTDLSILDGKVDFSATYYIKTVDDLILNSALPPSSGFTSEFVNAGELQNKGLELSLNSNIIESEDFVWNASVNWFKNTSKITRLDVDPFNVGAFGATLGTFRIEEGSSATQIVGIGPNPGANGFQRFGDSEPDFQMALNNSIQYKDFQLSFLWQWKKGGDNINLTTLLSDLNGTSADYDDSGLDPSGALANGPYRVSQLGSSADVFVEDASYLRLREVGLYYTIPTTTLENFLGGNIDNIKVGFSGTNLINIFDYNSYDPEVSNFGGGGIFTGVEVTPFPSSKRFLFNLAVNF